jgi:tetratricopeptide (TPR) repeat protein
VTQAFSPLLVTGLLGTLALSGCGGALPDAALAGPATAPEMPAAFHNKCDAAKGQLRPLVVEWAAPDRAALEAQAQKGQLVARYEGCDLEILRRCKAPAKLAYGYTAITPKDERVTIKDQAELYASIPVHAVQFEGKLAQSGQLTAEMTIVGEWGSKGLPPAVDQLEGECAGATHVVTALTVGAFSFFAGAAEEAGAKVSVLGAGAGAGKQSSSESLSRDGDVKACSAATRGDTRPPESCGALLRLELAALRAAGEGEPDCKPGTRLVGKECKPLEKPKELAPEDQAFTDDKRGFGWSSRCYNHYRAGALPYARAACDKALEADPEPSVKAIVLFNYGLVEKASGDPPAACDKLGRSLALRGEKDPGRAAVQKEMDKLQCAELNRPPQP